MAFQGKRLEIKKIAQIHALDTIGQGGRRIVKATNISLSTQHKYRRLTNELRNSNKEKAIDNSFLIIEMADEIVKEKINESSAKDAAVISKLQTDRLLDFTDPRRGANNTQVQVVPILGKTVTK